MASEFSIQNTNSETVRERIRMLNHDIKNCLAVVAFGLEAIRSTSQGSGEFEDVLRCIEQDGIAVSRSLLQELVQLADQLAEGTGGERSV